MSDKQFLETSIREVLVEALQIDSDLFTPELSFGDLPQWDSLGHMEVMMRLEEHYGIEINADTIASLTSVPKITEYLQRMENSGEKNFG